MMRAFNQHTGLVVPLERANVDTDLIIPKQFLKSVQRSGFGVNLFDALRYHDEGYPGKDPASRQINEQFILNQPRYQGASILLALDNFGCGSSREHAPWALDDYGFRVIIAPSFADIFYNNCFKNGLLPIVQPAEVVAQLIKQTLATPGYQLHIDLQRQCIEQLQIEQSFTFTLDPFRRKALLQGLDDIGLTLQKAEAIRAYEARRQQQEPWIFQQANTADN